VRNDGTRRSMLERSERIAQFVLGRLAGPAVHRQTVLGLELGHGRLGRRPVRDFELGRLDFLRYLDRGIHCRFSV
jgi:hypothetical protein